MNIHEQPLVSLAFFLKSDRSKWQRRRRGKKLHSNKKSGRQWGTRNRCIDQ